MDIKHYHPQIASIAETPCEYPKNRFFGAGIVICAGGRTYFTCAWVLVNMLRRLGCRLPIEVWYRGRHEMSNVMRRMLESVTNVYCMNAADQGDGRRLDGWEVKPYAITHSRFEEVLFLDCDNIPTRDPSGLFEEEAYRRYGAVFWPDRWMGKDDQDRHRTIWPQAWEACDVPQRDEPEFESGQILINSQFRINTEQRSAFAAKLNFPRPRYSIFLVFPGCVIGRNVIAVVHIYHKYLPFMPDTS
ncbi:MAG: hypothetical protein HQ559_10600 [Lentisphaerae bacterium]|nr:hypothetical protein [Lentisphaerota bacterium]